MNAHRAYTTSLLLLGALLAGEHRASAQSCVPSNASVTGLIGAVYPQGDAPPHPASVPATTINQADCASDESLVFTVGITGAVTTGQFQVWAGTGDCGSIAARTPATATCWPVTPLMPAQVNPMVVTIKDRDIVSQLTAPTKQVEYTSEAPATVCNAVSDAASSIPLTMFISDPQANVCGEETTFFSITADLAAPRMTGTVDTASSDGGLIVDLPVTNDPDVVAWNVYVDPPPGGTQASESTCGSSILAASADVGDSGVAPSASTIPSQYLALHVSSAESGGFISGLTNGVAYTVAVAAVDAAGNVGPLAVAPCGAASTPEATSAGAGTSSGGSSCAVATPGAAEGSGALLLGLAAVGAASRRRRRLTRTI